MKNSKKVVLCGFAGATLKGRDENFEAALRTCGFEIWTMNDWWNFLPWLKTPDRVFQVHCREDGSWSFPDQWGNDRIGKGWKLKYEASGAQIVVVADNGLSRQTFFPAEYIRKYGPSYFASSANYMMAMAIEEGYGTVSVQDCAMFAVGEYQEQLPALAYAIRDARKKGVDVICPFEAVWKDAGLDLEKCEPVPRLWPYGPLKDVFNLGGSADAQLRHHHTA